jgi:DNA-binding transcriptional ArsR family regulator
LLLKKKVATSKEIRNFVKKSPSVVSVNLSELFREKIITKDYDIPSNRYSLKNYELVKGVMNEYYPGVMNTLIDNTVEMFDF